ncbi:hypothetical protein IscW_ISCW010777 [Ixodes scapularis]|uniref:Uncharacterized protein n=1 Tax=Ixodes scapularis TaxID=6945 RepID=B7Q7B1_IXOSC|nr:hypothetical protein IscW_ISCW010777 [Ixodes scapularis]|eukprot:XP_002403859.1 hypothetical protein IscW_ISCW010777 [Ixodes scapularis]
MSGSSLGVTSQVFLELSRGVCSGQDLRVACLDPLQETEALKQLPDAAGAASAAVCPSWMEMYGDAYLAPPP